MAARDGMPSLEEVINFLQIPVESVLNVYPYGSHLYDLARPDSGRFLRISSLFPITSIRPLTRLYEDWDMIVVVKDHVGPLVKQARHPGAILPGFEEGIASNEKIDITVYHEMYWKKMVSDNVVRILYCTAIPKHMVLLEREPISIRLNYQKLKTNFYYYCKERERVAQGLWRTNQFWSAKKQLLHVLRVLEVSHQIVETGKIQDLKSANPYWGECQAAAINSFSELLEWYKKRYEPLYDTLKAKLNSYKEAFEQTLSPRINAMHILDYLQFHAHNDFEQLERETSITATAIDYPTTLTESLQSTDQDKHLHPLVLLERQWDSPRHPAIQQCYRMLVRRLKTTSTSEPNWKVVSLAPAKYWESGADKYVTDPRERFVGRLNIPSTRVYVKPQGLGVLLFWDHDKEGQKAELRAVYGTSGFYGTQYALRHKIIQTQLGHVLHKQFWSAFQQMKLKEPNADFNWTYHFIFHPEEHILRLDSIMDNQNFQDISMLKANTVIPNEESMEPLLEAIARKYLWSCLERIVVDFPSKIPKTENAVGRNNEVMTKLALTSQLSMLTHEGFIAMDDEGTRVQWSLPQYISLQMLLSVYERRFRIRHFLKIVRATIQSSSEGQCGEDRFCQYFPQWASWYQYMAAIFRKICADVDAAYNTVSTITDHEKFKAAAEAAYSFAQTKVLWKLRAMNVTAFEYFTKPSNLNEGPATQILHAWVDDCNVFEGMSLGDTA